MVSHPMKLSIIIPIYNEEKTLSILLNKVLALDFGDGIEKEIVLVNDGSRDSSWEIIQDFEKRFAEIVGISNEKNLGKSQTVRNGILKSTGEIVVIQDADLEYEPLELVDMLKVMLQDDFDVVYWNRFGKKNKVIYLQNYIGNKGLSFISNIFTYPRIRKYIPDMEVCYKMIKGDILRDIAKDIESKSNFGFEPEVTAKLSKYKLNEKHLRFGIMPVSYYPRSRAEGKKMKAIEDGVKALIEIIKFNLR